MQEQYTIRVYNSKDVERIEKLFKKCQDKYRTKNPFLVDCVMRGMEDIEKELFGVRKIETLTEIYNEIEKTLKKLDELIKMSRKNTNENLSYLRVISKLLSSNYNMLIGLSTDCPKQKEYIEAGLYDDLPERLSVILEELLKTFLK